MDYIEKLFKKHPFIILRENITHLVRLHVQSVMGKVCF